MSDVLLDVLNQELDSNDQLRAAYLHLQYIQHLEKVAGSVQAAEFKVSEGMPLAIWQDKYARKKPDGSYESWKERIRQVVIGNYSLAPDAYNEEEFKRAIELGVQGALVFAGRHLQHGDINQITKNMELFTNCSTSIFSYVAFWLGLNGSGVSSDYSTYTRRVNWDNMPSIRLVLNCGHNDEFAEWDGAHPDAIRYKDEFNGYFETLRQAIHKYPSESESVRWFEVEDSREGWVKVLEILETAAFQERHRKKLFIFDFSKVRGEGTPIMGQQGRPASGPLPLMRALAKVASIKGAGMVPWKQAIFIDNYISECISMGGVRRVARLCTKHWNDSDIFEYIEIKRGGHLKSANNSVLVDEQFYQEYLDPRTKAYRVFQAVCAASYLDKTGEPAFINAHRLNNNKENLDILTPEDYLNPDSKLQIHPRTREMAFHVLEYLKKMKIPFIVNPCSEVALAIWGGYCVIGTVNLARCFTEKDAFDAVRLQAHALVRTNTMNTLYKAEVQRTNRIGVSLTGVFEFAWNIFGLTFADLLSAYPYYIEGHKIAVDTPHQTVQALKFFYFLENLSFEATLAANDMADRLEMTHPHTVTVFKPEGTVSKILSVTEGANLPASTTYLRWVQHPKMQVVDGERIENPAVTELRERGYPVKDISHRYENIVIVGFPTKQPIVDALGDLEMATATSISFEDHFKWLRMLEKAWIKIDENGMNVNNQISYTAKFLSDQITLEEYMDVLRRHQGEIACCSYQPVESYEAIAKNYGYAPEQPISLAEYHALMANIRTVEKEAYDNASLQCDSGICPIEDNLVQ